MQTLLTLLTLASAVGSALVAGTFFAFSAFVMTALARRPAAEGMAAMQAINAVVVRSPFIAVFLATAIASALLALTALAMWGDARAVYWLAGAFLYGAGTFCLTIICNVPLNDALAAADAASQDGADRWARYLTDWTWWNHVRTGAAFAAMVCFILALA
jgi:uncharacterized membrane protein